MRSARSGATPIVMMRLAAVAQLAHESAPQQSAQLRPFVVPANRLAHLLRRRGRQRQHRIAPQRHLLDVLNEAKRLVFVAPELRRVAARRHELAAIIFLVNDVAAQIAQRRLQHVEDEFRPGRAAGRTGAEVGAELMLMFRLREIAQHVARRAEEDEPAALVEQDGLVKHLENLRARLVNRDDDDFVVRHPADDLDDVLGILRGQAGGRLVEEVDVGRADHVEADVEALSLAAAERFFHRAADDAVAPFAQAELDQFAFEAPRPVAPREVRGANRGGKLEVFPDRQVLVEGVVLRNVTDVTLERVEVVVKRLAVEQDLRRGPAAAARRAPA